MVLRKKTIKIDHSVFVFCELIRDENGLEVSQVGEKELHLLSFLYLAHLFTLPYLLHSEQINIETFIHAERTKE